MAFYLFAEDRIADLPIYTAPNPSVLVGVSRSASITTGRLGKGSLRAVRYRCGQVGIVRAT